MIADVAASCWLVLELSVGSAVADPEGYFRLQFLSCSYSIKAFYSQPRGSYAHLTHILVSPSLRLILRLPVSVTHGATRGKWQCRNLNPYNVPSFMARSAPKLWSRSLLQISVGHSWKLLQCSTQEACVGLSSLQMALAVYWGSCSAAWSSTHVTSFRLLAEKEWMHMRNALHMTWFGLWELS